MAPRGIDEQLVKYLTDAHGIEEQALRQLRAAPELAGDPELWRVYREHLTETERQERRVRERLEQLGASPSRLEDAAMRLGGSAFTMFARSQPDTPGKLAAHSYSYEHLELGAYELLRRIAERAGDDATARMAAGIGDEERAMGERLAEGFDRSAAASLHGVDPERFGDRLDDAHALEAQADPLLERGPRIIGDDGLARVMEEHLEESHGHQRAVERRLEARGARRSRVKDAALKLGALNWAGFFRAQPDTPAKLAAFAFAFEHLEIAGYEQLRRVAERAGDPETAAVAERILGEERAAAGRIAERWDAAVDASLDALQVAR